MRRVPESNPLSSYLSPLPDSDISLHFIYLPYFMPRFPSFRDLPNTAITDHHQTFTNSHRRHCHSYKHQHNNINIKLKYLIFVDFNDDDAMRVLKAMEINTLMKC